ncbi:zinc-ribbon domain-containing protein [Guptibacillus algicola]|uniref:zinc-ribbon domain-containing protein n=1 Tax=Guptibacillus algicola TaxID=225844 RepID=UPI001CD43D88|nr:zinc-ribbon domain-containing protein [Alkalihalobacillus algicola]MCA0988742.1 zinc-ribbon domain-containing protein [Alkalihalobacillus algicola]
MYCPHCGKKRDKNDQFCISCGKELVSEPKGIRSFIVRWLPVLVFFIIGSSLTGYYYYEESVTNAAIRSFEQGEQLAEKGDYKEAQNKFEKATAQRAQFPAAELNQNIMNSAVTIEDTLDSAEKARKKDNYTDALELVDDAEAELNQYKGPLMTDLQNDIASVRTTVMVAELKFDMKGKKSIEELQPVLTRAETLEVDEAKEVANQIRNQIIEFSLNEANKHLKDNRFSKALYAVEDGLQFNSQNEKLLNLKTVIEKRKNAFEEEQQKRIEQAMVAAAKEEEMNRTNAIELIDAKTSVTEYNELKITGSVKSKATVPVSSIGASYQVLDSKGKVFRKGEVYINPETLYPEDKGKFDFTIYEIDKEVKNLDEYTVQIDHFTWYVE